MSLLGVAPRTGAVALLVMVTGLSSASLHAIAPAMAGRLSGLRLGRGMGFWVVGGYVGLALGPIVAVTGVKLLTLEGTPWLMVGGWLGSGILYWRLRHVEQHTTMRVEESPCRAVVQSMRPILVPVVGILVALALVMSSVLTFLPTFLAERGSTLWLGGGYLYMVHIALALGALLAGPTSDRMGRWPVVGLSMVLPSVMMMAFVWITGWAQLPLLLGLGATVPASQVVLMALMQEHCGENRALANGVYLSLTFVTESLAVVVLGALGDLFGLDLAFAAGGVLLLSASLLCFCCPKMDRIASDGAWKTSSVTGS